jgi:hypothetical protein
MNDDKLRPSPFSDGTSRLPESVSDEGNDVTGVAGAGVFFRQKRIYVYGASVLCAVYAQGTTAAAMIQESRDASVPTNVVKK